MRYSLLELHRPTVGLHNLPHQLEAQAVFPALGTGDIRFLVQRLQPDIIHPHAIIGHCAGASPILRAHRNRDMAPLGIVDDAVADQIVQHPPELSTSLTACRPISARSTVSRRMGWRAYSSLVVRFRSSTRDFRRSPCCRIIPAW